MVVINNTVWNELIRDAEAMERSPRLAAAWCARLGELAPWWLSAKTIEQAAEYTGTRLRHDQAPVLGRCAVLIVSTGETPHAVALPLRWKADTTDDPRLPARLCSLADRVRIQLTLPTWGLHLDLPHTDLSGFTALSFDSGWAPLAIGLSLAGQAIKSNPKSWATGAWNNRTGGVDQVDRLEAKLHRAHELSANSFIVPPANANPARQFSARMTPSPEVVVLDASQQVSNALKPALVHAGVAPTLDEPLEERLAYRHFILDRSRNNEYYAKVLCPTLADLVRERSARPEVPNKFDLLVTFGSANTDQIALASRTYQVRNVVILHTKEYRRQCEQAAQWLQEIQINAELVTFAKKTSYSETYDELKAHLQPQLRKVQEPNQLVFDLTPGQRPMAASLEDLAPVGSWLIYLHHHYDQQNRPSPGEDHYECWRKTAERRFAPLHLDGFGS